MLSKLLLSMLMFQAAAATIVFPLHMRTVNSDTAKLIEFRDQHNVVTYVSYDTTRGRNFTSETLPYVTVPFGRMNVTMLLSTFTHIFATSFRRMEEEAQAQDVNRVTLFRKPSSRVTPRNNATTHVKG